MKQSAQDYAATADVAIVGAGPIGLEMAATLFIENSHQHVTRVAAAITGHWPTQIGTIESRRYELPLAQIEAN